MSNFTPYSALIGGLLIGASAVLLMASLGRIAGISGIAGGLLSAEGGERSWRLAFLIGLLLGAPVTAALGLAPGRVEITESLPLLTAAGLLVGFGTRLGSGCTSGHGVCGVARLSPRSLVATGVFMAVAALVVFLRLHVLGV